VPRITIDLDLPVIDWLRRRAIREGKSVGQVASELLACAVAEQSAEPAPEFTWVSADLGLSVVDLENPEAVLRVLASGP
jgi:plasmid stability protein